MSDELIFVYGTLRPDCDHPMAVWLRGVAEHVGRGWARGRLYRVEDYPAFVPGGVDDVVGDLFALRDSAAVLARLDAYEECSADDPQPHEYRRERIKVRGVDGPVAAWVYLYQRKVDGLERIAGGDFLA